MRRLALAIFVVSIIMSISCFAAAEKSGVTLVQVPLTEEEQLWFGGAHKYCFEAPSNISQITFRATVETYDYGAYLGTIGIESFIGNGSKFIVRVTNLTWSLFGDAQYDLLQFFGSATPIQTSKSFAEGFSTWITAETQPLEIGKEFTLGVGLYGLKSYSGETIADIDSGRCADMLKVASAVYRIRCQILAVN